MLTTQNWIDAGYKKFNPARTYAEYGLQKCIKDALGKKYYITVYVYDFSKYIDYPEKITFEPTVQFCPYNLPTVNITLITNLERDTVETIEALLEKYWEFSGRPYYELYGY